MHFIQRGGDYDLWGHKSPRPATSVSPPENLDTYVLKYDKVIISYPVYDPKTGDFLRIGKPLGFATTRGYVEECRFDYV